MESGTFGCVFRLPQIVVVCAISAKFWLKGGSDVSGQKLKDEEQGLVMYSVQPDEVAKCARSTPVATWPTRGMEKTSDGPPRTSRRPVAGAESGVDGEARVLQAARLAGQKR